MNSLSRSLRGPWFLAVSLAVLLQAGCSGDAKLILDPPDDDDTPTIFPPIAGVTSFVVDGVGGEVRITWANPGQANFDSVLLVRFDGAIGGAAPVDGQIYAVGGHIGTGEVIYTGADAAFVDQFPMACGDNTYAIWTRDDSGVWSSTMQSAAIAGGEIFGPPTTPPSVLNAVIGTTLVDLTWSNADPSTGACEVRVVRTEGAPPTGPNDGALVFSGVGTSASDPMLNLFPGTAYFYGAYHCNDSGDCETTGSITSVTPTVIECLRGGGYVIRWRHATATVCADNLSLGTAATTSVPDWWKSCDSNCPPAGMSNGRQLSAIGVNEATTIGNDMRGNNIPIGRVWSSEFCRCIQTAEFMAFGVPIELRQDITFFVHDEANRCNSDLALIAVPPAADTNTAIIGHSGFTCPILDNLASGEAAIYKPDGVGGARFVTRVSWNEWGTIPPNGTMGLTVTPVGTTVEVTWTNPLDVSFDSVLVVRFRGAIADATPVDGTTYVQGETFGSGEVIFSGVGTLAIDSAPWPCDDNTYATWVRDVAGNWSLDTQVATIAGVGGAPTTPPSGLAANIDITEVDLTWNNADPSTGACNVRLLRTQDVPPTGPNDGTVIFSGVGSAASDALVNLFPGISYFYTVYHCNDSGACETVGSATSITPTLVECLRGGGYNIRWRHASADVCADRTDLGTAATTLVPDWWKSCDSNCPPGGMATARQLNSAGVNEAITIGNDMTARGIPIGRVLSSEFCRNIDTAVNMAFPPTIEQRQDITYFVYDEANRCNAEYVLLAELPAAGTNTAIIGHSGFPAPCPDLGILAWGQAAIFKPDGFGGSQLITTVMWDAWSTLP